MCECVSLCVFVYIHLENFDIIRHKYWNGKSEKWPSLEDIGTLRSCMPYPLLSLGWNTSMLERCAARRVRLCLPLPPTPMSRAWPLGHARMRLIRQLFKKSVYVITVKCVFIKGHSADVTLTRAAWPPGTAPGSWWSGAHCSRSEPHSEHS